MTTATAQALNGNLITLLALLTACVSVQPNATDCAVSLIVLGVAQDGGKPQIGHPEDPAWDDASLRRLATSIALVDTRGGATKRWLFDATPDIKAQLQSLDEVAPVPARIGLDGIFLTHAHIGHYTGLMLLGHEAAGAKRIPVYAMPRMREYLATNGPWSQLVRYKNIELKSLSDGRAATSGNSINVTPFIVPHRQEYSEVAGFRIDGPNRSAIYLPDIDSWDEWDASGTRIEDVLRSVDIAFLDATFYDGNELPGRDMSGFPHPFIRHSMTRFEPLAASEKRKVHFIHMNHTNPVHDPDSAERRGVLDAGFNVAREGLEECL